MSRLSPLRNPWVTTSVALTVGIAIMAAAAGFVGLPMLQTAGQFRGTWDAICSAAGLVRTTPATEVIVQPPGPTSRVVMAPALPAHAADESVGRGATLALRCTTCHGARGLGEAGAPNLAGQYAAVVSKQLHDYASGARTSSVMTPLAAELTDGDMADLAGYYAYLPRPGETPAAARPPRIVASGAPMRGIAPCGTCHGAVASKAGSAWLAGQPPAYLREQLQTMASGARHNDISGQMRNIARQMTQQEIEQAVLFYGRGP